MLCRADEVEASGASICFFPSMARERKGGTHSGSIVCQRLLVICFCHEELSERVKVPETVVNPSLQRRGLQL